MCLGSTKMCLGTTRHGVGQENGQENGQSEKRLDTNFVLPAIRTHW